MPANSIALRRLAGLAEHHPEKVYKKNRSILGMSGIELHKFASGPEKGLPYKTKKKKRR
jgi:hypothetical protein